MAYDTKRKYWAGLYTQGVITGEELVELQRQADLEEAEKLNAKVAQIMGADYLSEDKPKPAPKQPTEQPKSGRPSLVGMTKEQFESLSMYEQNELYNIAPDYIEKIMNDRPAYMDLLEPQPKAKDYKGLTTEEFKSMTIGEMQELWDADPDTYKRVLEATRKTDPSW